MFLIRVKGVFDDNDKLKNAFFTYDFLHALTGLYRQVALHAEIIKKAPNDC